MNVESRPPYVYSIKRYSSKITISRIALVIRLWITNPPWRVDNNSPTSFHENIPWNIPENNRLSRERLENCILVSIFPSPLPPPPPRSRMIKDSQGSFERRENEGGGGEASEFPSCRGGDAGEDADARRQIEHPRRDNIITGCFRARMPAFSRLSRP